MAIELLGQWQEEGGLRAPEIAVEIDSTTNTTGSMLHKLKSQGRVFKVGNRGGPGARWFLTDGEYEAYKNRKVPIESMSSKEFMAMLKSEMQINNVPLQHIHGVASVIMRFA